jgi:guanosine-3',5'-bis(diphosphate) 3'-pyrophosphohydrolase
MAKKTKRVEGARDVELWQDAAAFAARAHRNQVRRDGKTPYVSHVFRVAMTVTQVFGCTDSVVIAAALLHDTIEDTTTDYEDIEERFGGEVAALVSALTKNMALPEDEREEEYDARLARADWRARLVKLGDVYDNYCDVVSYPTAKKRKEKKADALDKARRALALAENDAGNPLIDRGLWAVRQLIGE